MEDLKTCTKEELGRRKEALEKEIIDKKTMLAALSAEMASNLSESQRSVLLFEESQKRSLSAEGYKALCARETLCKKNRSFLRCLARFLGWLTCFSVLFGLTVCLKGMLMRYFPFDARLLFSVCAILEIVLSLFIVKALGAPAYKKIQAINRVPEIKQYDKSTSRFRTEAARAVVKKNDVIKAKQAHMESAIEQARKRIEEIEDRLASLGHPNTIYVFVANSASRYRIYLDGALCQTVGGARVFVAQVEAGPHSLRVEEEYGDKKNRLKAQNGILVFLADEDAHFFVVEDELEETSVSKLLESARKRIQDFSIE